MALDINYIRELKEGRIQAQYYLQSLILEDEQKVKKFVLRCKTILADLDSEKIESFNNYADGWISKNEGVHAVMEKVMAWTELLKSLHE